MYIYTESSVSRVPLQNILENLISKHAATKRNKIVCKQSFTKVATKISCERNYRFKKEKKLKNNYSNFKRLLF